MSLAEDLLNSLTEEEQAAYLVDQSGEPHIVINPDKTVTVPESVKRIAVEGDHDVKTITFDCPRYWDGHDLSEMKLRIVFQRPDGHRESHLAENPRIDTADESVINFDWTISGNVTAVKGNISFMVCGKRSNAEGVREREWHTRLNQDLIVDEGMDCSNEEVVERNPDIIEAILVQLDELHNASGVSDEQITNVIEAYMAEHPIDSGQDAVQFTKQTLTEEQQAQARKNIGIAGYPAVFDSILEILKHAAYDADMSTRLEKLEALIKFGDDESVYIWVVGINGSYVQGTNEALLNAGGTTRAMCLAKNTDVPTIAYGSNYTVEEPSPYSPVVIPDGAVSVTVKCPGFRISFNELKLVDDKWIRLYGQDTNPAPDEVTYSIRNAEARGLYIKLRHLTDDYGSLSDVPQVADITFNC